MTVAQSPARWRPVAFVDVLDHLLAPFVFEIDVDVGGFVAGFRHKAFEDHRADFRGDGGDAEAVADDRVGGRAAALAEDAAGAGELDDVVDGEEVGLVLQLPDERELVFHERLHAVGGAGGVAPFQALVGEAAEALGCRLSGGDLGGVFVAQLVEGECEPRGDVARAVDGVFVAVEEGAHLGFGAEAAFGIGERGAAELVHAAPGADGGEDVRQAAAAAVMHEGGGRSDGVEPETLRQPGEAVEAAAVLPVVAGGEEDVAGGGEAARQPFRL
jgi:hypothetical protein